jgi:hypothetical protein
VAAAERAVRDFFISYAGVNRPWAEWIAVELERAGYSTVLQAWDFRPGTDFMHMMQEAPTSAQRTIAVLSCPKPTEIAPTKRFFAASK